jgi:excisionase family DNA binding protein
MSKDSDNTKSAGLRDLLTAAQVADLTGLSKETLAQWRSQRRGLSYLKIGRAVRYDPVDVQAYLQGCRVSVSDPQERRHE